MASVVADNWEYIENNDDFEGLEFSQINQGLLMSLLDETQVDDCDDERLNKVIQSLEAEINPNSQDSMDWNDEFNSQDWPMPHDLDHHNWMQDVEDVLCSPSGDHVENWNSEHGIAGTSVVDQWTDDKTRIHDHLVSSVAILDHNPSFI